MSQNYIGLNGIVTQTYQEILDDLIAKFKAIYGSDINVEQNTADGQWLHIMAQEKQDMLDLMVQYYNNLDVDRVIGIPQQILYKLNGLTIKKYSFSYVYVNVSVTSPVTLQGLDADIDSVDGTGYTVADNNGNQWILAETQTLAIGTHLLNFRAAQLGNVTCATNSIQTMITVIKGIESVNNPAVNYIMGAHGESDSEYRLRRDRSMYIPSQGFEESIESQLLNLDNVTNCKVYSNRESTTQQTIPPHTLWVIVEGGLRADIGRVIYNNLPPGIPMKGQEEVEIAKNNGDLQSIYFDYPTAVDLYIQANIKNFTASTLDVDYIKQELARTTFTIGEMAQSANLLTVLKDIVGQTGMPYDLEISSDGVTYVEYLSPTNLDEYFTIDTNNITLTVV